MPAWTNWSGNIEAPIGNETYLVPTSLSQLQGIVAGAAKQGVTLRVSGQRHSQSPLVASDSRGGGSAVSKKAWLVDLSCYADLGPKGDQRIVLDPSGKKVTVNAGVREDELDAFSPPATKCSGPLPREASSALEA